MPTNLPPQYREAEGRYRQAKTPQEKIAALQEMLAIMPKHKGTDHVKAQLRARLSQQMMILEGPSKGPSGSGRVEPFSLPKQGAGRATLIGPTNVGKFLILAKATGAQTRIGAYALSTQEPVPGMFPYEDVAIQAIDTPPISDVNTQSRLYGLLRNSDIFVVVLDLSADPVGQAREVLSVLDQWGFRLLGRGESPDGDNRWLTKPAILVGNKADIPGALDGFQEHESVSFLGQTEARKWLPIRNLSGLRRTTAVGQSEPLRMKRERDTTRENFLLQLSDQAEEFLPRKHGIP